MPALHVSGAVHALPSLQDAVLLVNTQPLPGLQVSLVQTFPSLQASGAPPTHVPPVQVSFVEHALPSLQGLLLLLKTQPLAGLQLSFVQPLLSLQVSGGPPTHVPPEQVSFVEQALPSLQGSVLFVNTQPLAGLQLSFVQPLSSLHVSGAPPTHDPAAQVSFVEHALPSSQGSVLFV